MINLILALGEPPKGELTFCIVVLFLFLLVFKENDK